MRRRGQGEYLDQSLHPASRKAGLTSSDRARYHSNRGAAHLNLGDYDLAIADLDESLRLDPDDTLAIYNRGATYFHKEDCDRALADLNAP